MKVDLTAVAKSLSGETARIELARLQTSDGRIASRQRDMVLQDVFYSATGNATLKDSAEIAALRELTKKVKTGAAFTANDDEFARLYALYRAQKFYIFDSFLEMVETLNSTFDMTACEAGLTAGTAAD